MRQQRNMFQTKKQDKTSEEVNKVEIGNAPDKEMKVMIIKMLNELRRRMKSEKLGVFN